MFHQKKNPGSLGSKKQSKSPTNPHSVLARDATKALRLMRPWKSGRKGKMRQLFRTITGIFRPKPKPPIHFYCGIGRSLQGEKVKYTWCGLSQNLDAQLPTIAMTEHRKFATCKACERAEFMSFAPHTDPDTFVPIKAFCTECNKKLIVHLHPNSPLGEPMATICNECVRRLLNEDA